MPGAPKTDRPSLLWSPLLVLATTVFTIEIPFFFYGTPSGHDVEFHLYSWLEVLAQWKQGIRFPRWAALAHFAYGEPRFIFYPPASWTLGAAISAICPWSLASPVYIWIVLVAAGASMFLLAREWLGRRDAIFAAALYAVNPYHLVIVYWRSAFAEMLASCLLPLMVLLLLRAVEKGWKLVVPLACILAAAWLTNAPAAVMIHYSLALLIVVLAWKHRSPRLLAVGAAAVLLGACLAAFYLFPAIYEQRWINIDEAVSAGSRPLDNFLFVHTTDEDHDKFNRIISSVAVGEMIAVFVALWAAAQWRKARPDLWIAMAAWASACGLLMFSVTGFLWDILPKMRFMQFPWRWTLCLSMIFALFVATGLKQWWTRGLVCAAMLLVIVGGWRYVQPPWWDTRADLREMQDNMIDGPGYEGTDEYTPRGADPSAVDKDAHRMSVEGPEHAAFRIQQWNAMSKAFVADMSGSSRLRVRLFNYPAWQVEVNGRVVDVGAVPASGQMLIPVNAGVNRVQINFLQTWDRRVGKWISLISALGPGLWWMLRNKRFSAHGLRTTAAILIFCFVFLSGSGAAQEKTGTGRRLPEERLVECLKSRFPDDRTVQYSASYFDLNEDGNDEVLVLFVSRSWCGSGGCTMFILSPQGNSYKVVAHIPAMHAPIRVLEQKSNGWDDLTVLARGVGTVLDEAILAHNGKKYSWSSSKVPQGKSPGSLPGKIVLPGDASMLPLFSDN